MSGDQDNNELPPLDPSIASAAGLEMSSFGGNKHLLFSTPNTSGEPLATRPIMDFNTPQFAKAFMFGTPSNPVPPPDQLTYASSDALSDALVEGNFLRFNSNGLAYPINRPTPRVTESSSEEPAAVESGSDSDAKSSRSSGSNSGDIRVKLLEKMEKIQSMAATVQKELREYMLLSESTLRDRASTHYNSESAETYTCKLEYVQPPSDTEYCNKGIDPPIEVQLLDMQGNLVTDRSIPLRIVICDGESRPLDKTTTGGPLVTGTAEATLTKGRAVFSNLRIMEVSSKHMNKCFHIVVEAKTRQGVQPVVSSAVRVYAKKMAQAPKQKRGYEDSSDKRQKY